MNLREIAKFLSGLVVGDFLVGLWLWSSGDLPVNFLGWRFNAQGAMWWMAFDAAVFIGLAYYAWGKEMGKKKKK